MTRVVNLFRERYDVYIGRPGRGSDGCFGNPYRVGRRCPRCGSLHISHGSTLECFREYFEERVANDPVFRARVLELKGKILGCFCKPDFCHGDVIASWLNAASA